MPYTGMPFIELTQEIIDQKFTLCKSCPSMINEFSMSQPIINCGLPPIYNTDVKCPCLECLVLPTCTKECKPFGSFKKTVGRDYENIAEKICEYELERRHKEKNGGT